jgi:hypothetical protein
MVEADKTDKEAEKSAMSVDAKEVATTTSAAMDNKIDSDVATNASPVKSQRQLVVITKCPLFMLLLMSPVLSQHKALLNT